MKCACGENLLLDKEKNNKQCTWCFFRKLKPYEEDQLVVRKEKGESWKSVKEDLLKKRTAGNKKKKRKKKKISEIVGAYDDS